MKTIQIPAVEVETSFDLTIYFASQQEQKHILSAPITTLHSLLPFLHKNRIMKTTFNTVTALLLGSLMFATVVSGRQIRGTNEQQQAEQGSTSITDSLLSWIRRDQEVDVQPVAAEDGENPVSATNFKRSEIRARPEINEGGLSHVFDEFRNWEPTDAQKAKLEEQKELEEKEGATNQQEGVEKKQGAGTGKNGMKWMKNKVITVGGEARGRDLRSDNAYAKGAQTRGRHEGVGNINFWRKSGLNKFRNEDRRRLVMS